jgi:predicted enzyme related to lactoylglutathione lyase
MGQPVVHFEVIGRDGSKLQSYYGELFGWQIDANNPIGYGTVQREGTRTRTASASAAAWAAAPRATRAT